MAPIRKALMISILAILYGCNPHRPDLLPLTRNNVLVFYDQRGGGRSELPADTALLAAHHFIEDLETVRKHFALEQ